MYIFPGNMKEIEECLNSLDRLGRNAGSNRGKETLSGRDKNKLIY